MTICRYPSSPVVDQITFRKSDGGAMRAYLHAKDGSDPASLDNINRSLSRKGFQCVPMNVNGQPLLEVRNFKREADITLPGQQSGWLSGKPERVVEKEDHITFADKLRKRSLQAAGGVFFASDLAYMKYGYQDASPLDVAGGMMYSAGTISSLLLGRKDPSDLQIKDLSGAMAKELQKQPVTNLENTALVKVTDDKHQSALQKLDTKLRHYPAEFMNASYALAGVCIAAAAYRSKLKGAPELQTFVNNVEKFGNALKGQTEQLEVLSKKTVGTAEKDVELKELLERKLAKLAKHQPLTNAEVDEIERHTGELEMLRKATRVFNHNPGEHDYAKLHQQMEEELSAKQDKLAEQSKKTPSADVKLGVQKEHLDQLKAGSGLHQMAAAETVKHMRREGIMDVGLGTTTLASGMFGALVTEKPIDKDTPKETGVAGAWQWMQAHPLSVTAMGYMVSTLCHAASTTVAHINGNADRRRTVAYRAAFVAGNVLAEILIAMSSKGHGHGVKSDNSVDDSVYAISAEAIARQPQASQEGLVNYVAGFLSQKDVMGVDAKEAAAKLQHEVEAMRQNPWALASERKAPERSPQQPAAPANANVPPSWQVRVANQPPAAQPGLSA